MDREDDREKGGRLADRYGAGTLLGLALAVSLAGGCAVPPYVEVMGAAARTVPAAERTGPRIGASTIYPAQTVALFKRYEKPDVVVTVRPTEGELATKLVECKRNLAENEQELAECKLELDRIRRIPPPAPRVTNTVASFGSIEHASVVAVLGSRLNYGLAVSPDGARLAAFVPLAGVVEADTAGTDRFRNLLLGQAPPEARVAIAVPDEQGFLGYGFGQDSRLYALTQAGDGRYELCSETGRTSEAFQAVTRLHAMANGSVGFAASREGRWEAWELRERRGGGPAAVRSSGVALDGVGAEESVIDFDVSPSGRWTAVVVMEPGPRYRLDIVDSRSGGRPVRLPPLPAGLVNLDAPRFAPAAGGDDPGRLAYFRTEAAGNAFRYRLVILDIPTGNEQPFDRGALTDAYEPPPVWHPSGEVVSHLFFDTRRFLRLAHADVQGGSRVIEQQTMASGLAWRPGALYVTGSLTGGQVAILALSLK